MRARDVVGKRIVRISQKRAFDPSTGGVVVSTESIHLHDGTVIHLIGRDDGIDTFVTTFTTKPGRESR